MFARSNEKVRLEGPLCRKRGLWVLLREISFNLRMYRSSSIPLGASCVVDFIEWCRKKACSCKLSVLRPCEGVLNAEVQTL